MSAWLVLYIVMVTFPYAFDVDNAWEQLENHLLGDYCDGSDFRGHPLFTQEHKALQLMLYYDELEVCNPLGTKSKIHNLGEILRHICPILCTVLFSFHVCMRRYLLYIIM